MNGKTNVAAVLKERVKGGVKFSASCLGPRFMEKVRRNTSEASRVRGDVCDRPLTNVSNSSQLKPPKQAFEFDINKFNGCVQNKDVDFTSIKSVTSAMKVCYTKPGELRARLTMTGCMELVALRSPHSSFL